MNPDLVTVNPDPVTEDIYGSGLENGYSFSMGCNQNFGEVKVEKEEEEAKQEAVPMIDVEPVEEENEVLKLSEELMAYKSYMKFYTGMSQFGSNTHTSLNREDEDRSCAENQLSDEADAGQRDTKLRRRRPELCRKPSNDEAE